jgi:hypothetical protein
MIKTTMRASRILPAELTGVVPLTSTADGGLITGPPAEGELDAAAPVDVLVELADAAVGLGVSAPPPAVVGGVCDEVAAAELVAPAECVGVGEDFVVGPASARSSATTPRACFCSAEVIGR